MATYEEVPFIDARYVASSSEILLGWVKIELK